MIRNVSVMAAVLLLAIVLGVEGWLLGAKACVAQNGATAVGAVATDWVTNFEPDPFNREQLRGSTVTVHEIVVLWSDGRTELRQLRK
ncbi:MAG: hypothetical protein ACUVX8_03990 [Candidatus Zipacnadales bacterium]